MASFDTVNFRCPTCNGYNKYQSKVGDCSMKDYTLFSAPIIIVGEMYEESKNNRLICDICNKPIGLEVKTICNLFIKE